MNPDAEIQEEFPPFLRIYRSGRVERLTGTATVPAGVDPATGVASKDVLIDPSTGVSARLYLPPDLPPDAKLPVLVFYHGGAFCIESPFSPIYHRYLNVLIQKSRALAVSVDYRLAPEHLLPAAYDDSWTALRWIAKHAVGDASEPWLAEHADFNRVFLSGDSAGGNIVHRMAMLVGGEGREIGLSIKGVALQHTYFWGSRALAGEPEEAGLRAGMERMWKFLCPSATEGLDDVRVNPLAEAAPGLARLGCQKVVVFVAEKDIFRERGRAYYEALKKSGWKGEAELVEHTGVGHVFHLFDPGCDNAKHFLDRMASFLNQ